MQKKIILIILLFKMSIDANGQNLIPNSSFENYGTLPCSWITAQSGFNSAMQNWMMPTNGTPDIFSTLVPVTCFANCLSTNTQAYGSQLPRTGNIMSSICTYGTGCGQFPNYREYIEVMLTSPLIPGHTYYAEMYVSHTDYSKEATNNIGMYFSDTFINFPSICTTLNYTPQINENSIITNDTGWVLISGIFTATSSAQYMVVGNFYNDNNTDTVYFPNHSAINGRYFVDDFSLMEVNPCTLIAQDTTICEGSSASVLVQGDSFIGWAIDSLPNVIISSDALLITSPTQTTTYLAYSICDTIPVVVNVIPAPIVNLGNDTTLCDGQNITLDASAANIDTYQWQDNSSNATFTISQQGIFWVQLNSVCGIASDTIQVIYNQVPFVDLGNDTTLCTGQNITLDASAANIDTYQWQDNSSNATFTISQQGMYWVQASSVCGLASDTIQVIYIQAPSVNLGNDTTLCTGQNITLDASAANIDTYQWQDNSSNATFTISQQGMYWVQASSVCGLTSDTIQVIYIQASSVNLGNDTTLCTGQNITLDVSATNIDTYQWQDNSSNATFTISQQGMYWVQASSVCGLASDTIQVIYIQAPSVNLGNDTTLCTGQNITLDASAANIDTYQWQDNSSNATFTISQQGMYWVQLNSVCGIASDTIEVIYNQTPFVDLGNDTTLCQGQILNLDATFPNATYLWQDNANTSTYSINQQGTYWLNIMLNNCIVHDTIVVNYTNAMPVVNLGNDTTACEGQLIILNAFTPNASYLWQDNSTLPNIVAMQEGTYFVQVTNSCGMTTDSVYLDFNPIPQLSISNIVSPSCFGFNNGSATVTAQATGVLSYVWNTGLSTGPTINQLSSGNYAVTVYDAIGCSSSINININEPDSITANIQTNNAICALDNGSAQISASGGTGALTYLWSNNESSNMITNLPGGIYTVSVTDSLGCVKIVSATIVQTGIFTIDAGLDHEINYGDAVELIATGPENAFYSWWPLDYLSCAECTATIANPIETTEYILTVIKDGCKLIDTVTVSVDQKCNEIYVPTAFSPNDDLVNNIFVVRGNCISEINFKIFDRWGQVIFESNDQNIGWDGTFKGKALNEGVYVYTLYAVVKGKSIFQNGNVTLIRN